MQMHVIDSCLGMYLALAKPNAQKLQDVPNVNIQQCTRSPHWHVLGLDAYHKAFRHSMPYVNLTAITVSSTY